MRGGMHDPQLHGDAYMMSVCLTLRLRIHLFLPSCHLRLIEAAVKRTRGRSSTSQASLFPLLMRCDIMRNDIIWQNKTQYGMM